MEEKNGFKTYMLIYFLLVSHYTMFLFETAQARIQGGCFGGCSTPGYESQKKKKKGKREKRKKERKESIAWSV